jgi:PilZ domain-containing protein
MRALSSDLETRRREERRKGERFTLILRVGVLEQMDKVSLCLVKNISSTGVQIKFYTQPMVGNDATIRVADEPAVKGQVVWIKGDTAGLSFDEELDSARLLRVRQKLDTNRRRSVPRVSVNASATLRTGGRTRHATICDISSLGARIRTSSILKTGDRAVISFAELPPITAFVRWCDGDEVGLAFETPIPMQIIAQWIEGQLRLSA